ncbi:MAG: hypothetical protein LC753_15305 [Acidobacteria bacterium]|nr:hypothetical protein [Acidobacteriota bacterium]MCA1651575.1 hypothetical protein [Acidobacteriota bacterium]
MPRVRLVQAFVALCACLLAGPVRAQDVPAKPDAAPVLEELIAKGASIFDRDDVLWLLPLRIGEQLPGTPDRVAELLQERYAHEGFEAAEVHASYDAATGRLTLDVEEGEIDGIEITGLRASRAEAFRAGLEERGIRTGIIYNARDVSRAVNALLTTRRGLSVLDQAGSTLSRAAIAGYWSSRFHASISGSRSVRACRRARISSTRSTAAPGLSFEAVRFDHRRLNHTFIGGHLAYKFGREEPGFSIGFEQGLLRTPRAFAGAEVHDITASDDWWRISSTEQSLVALTFKNTFRDYYRRRGVQVFAAVRPGSHHEMVVSLRKDRHEALGNETDYSFFRDDHPYRPNPATPGGDINAPTRLTGAA